MARFEHPRTGAHVDVSDHDRQLHRYYRGEGYREAGDPLPPIEENAGRELFHPGYGEPMHGIEVPLGETADISNDLDPEPGDITPTDSGEPAGISLEI